MLEWFPKGTRVKKWNDCMRPGTWRVSQTFFFSHFPNMWFGPRQEHRRRLYSCVQNIDYHIVNWAHGEPGSDQLYGQQEFIKQEQDLKGKLGWNQESQMEGSMLRDAYRGGQHKKCVIVARGRGSKVWNWENDGESKKMRHAETYFALNYFD